MPAGPYLVADAAVHHQIAMKHRFLKKIIDIFSLKYLLFFGNASTSLKYIITGTMYSKIYKIK